MNDSYSQVSFYGPKSILVKNSIIYIADSKNNCIRKVDTINKIVTTIAGGLINHAFGESIPASQYYSENLVSNTFFYKNELYFVEGTNILRKISNGLIKTVLGSSQNSLTETLPTRIYIQQMSKIGIYENGDIVIQISGSNNFALYNLESQVFTKFSYDTNVVIYGIATYGKSFAEGLLALSFDSTIAIYNGIYFYSELLHTSLISINLENDILQIYFVNYQEIWKVKVSEMENATLVTTLPYPPYALHTNNGKIYASDTSRLYEIENGNINRIAGLPVYNVSGNIFDYYGYNGENKPLDQTAL